MIIPKSQWPKYLLQFKKLKGIYYGGCILHKGRKGFREKDTIAHTHVVPGAPREGWMCIASKEKLKIRLLMLHEVAHILVGWKYNRRHWHDDVWRKQLLKIGGTLDPISITKIWETLSYHKRRK